MVLENLKGMTRFHDTFVDAFVLLHLSVKSAIRLKCGKSYILRSTAPGGVRHLAGLTGNPKDGGPGVLTA